MEIGHQSHASNISDDGSTAIGFYRGNSWEQAFTWNIQEGFTSLSSTADSARAFGVSRDGSVIVGTYAWTVPYHYRMNLNIPSNVHPDFFDVTPDGEVFVGNAKIAGDYQAVMYSESAGLTLLGVIPRANSFGDSSIANAVSGDGRTVVGTNNSFDRSDAFLWTEQSGMEKLADEDSHIPFTVANDISNDGSTVVGFGLNGDYPVAVRWTDADGATILSVPQEYFSSTATAISGNGKMIIGNAGSVDGAVACVWTKQKGMQTLEQLLIDDGVDLEGWSLVHAAGISNDGRVIVGSAYRGYYGQQFGFVAILSHGIPEPSSLVGGAFLFPAMLFSRRLIVCSQYG
jgi:uncharacterized membrane protein